MPDRNKAFVITSPSEDRRALYDNVIKPLFEEDLAWDCVHLDDFVGAGNKIRDLVTSIKDATLVVVDLTEIQGDVFYELGIAHVLSNRVLTLACKGRDTTPSHLRTHRVIEYEDSASGGRRLAREIREAVRMLPEWSSRPSNPVQDVLLTLNWLAVHFNEQPSQEQLDFIQTLRDLQQKLEEAPKDDHGRTELTQTLRELLQKLEDTLRGEGQERTALTQTLLDQQQQMEVALKEKVDQMQAQMLLKLEEVTRAAGLQSGVIDVSLLNRQIDELRAQFDTMSRKRQQAERYLDRLVGERDTIAHQMALVAHTLEANQQRLISDHDQAQLVFVPAALIVPGPPRATEAERQQAERFVQAFYIDLHLVTNAQFVRFVQATGYQTVLEREHSSNDPTWRTPLGPGSSIAERMNHPVVWVYREDALAYAEWAHRRLPTRFEWERAMRGVAGHPWPWGAQWDAARCNLNTQGTTPVHAFPSGASPVGCRDMVGNVWEWLADALSGEKLVLMGGSWSEQTLKVGYKQLVVPGDGTDGATGFRCAMDVPGERGT